MSVTESDRRMNMALLPLYFGRLARMRCSSEENCSMVKRYRSVNSSGVKSFSMSDHVMVMG